MLHFGFHSFLLPLLEACSGKGKGMGGKSVGEQEQLLCSNMEGMMY